MKLGVATPDLLVDVSRLPHDRVEPLPDGGLRIGAAVASAVAHATGVRVRGLPITVEKLIAPPL
jgi:xanthine dehydrogenase YagS FAD-binding subunit